MRAKHCLHWLIALAAMLIVSPQSHAGSTDEIRNLISENPYDAARLPAEQLCELNLEARRAAGISDNSLLCDATQGPIDAPAGLDAEGQAYYEQLTEKLERGLEISEEQKDYSSSEMNICKKILCATAPGGPGSIKECEDDSGPSDLIVSIIRGKRPKCPIVQW